MAEATCTINVTFDTDFIDKVTDLLETQKAIIEHYHNEKSVIDGDHYVYLIGLQKEKAEALDSCEAIVNQPPQLMHEDRVIEIITDARDRGIDV